MLIHIINNFVETIWALFFPLMFICSSDDSIVVSLIFFQVQLLHNLIKNKILQGKY